MVRTILDRATIADAITEALDRGDSADHVIDWLSREYGASCRPYCGAYVLRVGGLQVSCTVGREAVLRRWVRKARAA